MLIVMPNPAVDHTVQLAELRPGRVIRAHGGYSVAGGKGGNVARAATCLGVRASVLAPVPDEGGDRLRALYAAEGIGLIAVPVSGRVRSCIALLEEDGRVTLINEPGPELASAGWDRLMAQLAELIDGAETRPGTAGPIVCSGSLPPGAPVDGYARIVAVGHRASRPVLVDASGEALALAISAGADLVCPNLSAAAAVTGAPSPVPDPVHDAGGDVPERAANAAAALRDLGAGWAVVTAGAAGAAVAGPDVTAWLAAPPVTVRNPIGAGDSFLAGLVTARIAGRDWPAAIRRGLAAGGASVEQPRAGVLDPARVDQLEASITAG